MVSSIARGLCHAWILCLLFLITYGLHIVESFLCWFYISYLFHLTESCSCCVHIASACIMQNALCWYLAGILILLLFLLCSFTACAASANFTLMLSPCRNLNLKIKLHLNYKRIATILHSRSANWLCHNVVFYSGSGRKGTCTLQSVALILLIFTELYQFFYLMIRFIGTLTASEVCTLLYKFNE